jgi:hypothetical protein
MVQQLRVQETGFALQVSGFRVQGAGFRGSEFKLEGL